MGAWQSIGSRSTGRVDAVWRGATGGVQGTYVKCEGIRTYTLAQHILVGVARIARASQDANEIRCAQSVKRRAKSGMQLIHPRVDATLAQRV